MTIDEARYLIEHHKPNDVKNAYELGEAFCVATNIMRKYQKINALYLEYKAQNIGFDTFALNTMEVLKDDNIKT